MRRALGIALLVFSACQSVASAPATAAQPVPVEGVQPVPVTPQQPFPITAIQPFPVPGFDPGTPAPATATGDGPCHVYARRCDPGCRSAFLAAVPNCQLDASTMSRETTRALGRCLVACNAGSGSPTCVGSATPEQCQCQLACYRSSGLTPEQIAQARSAAECLHAAIGGACE